MKPQNFIPSRARNLWSVLTVLTVALSGCSEGGDDNAAGAGAISEVPCQVSTETFDASGAQEPKLLLAQLPPGEYIHENSEVYVDQEIQREDGNTRDPVVSFSRMHFLEREIGPETRAQYETGRRCFETRGTLVPFMSQSVLLTQFTKYNDATYDTNTRVYNIDFRSWGNSPSQRSATLSVAVGTDNRSVSVSMISNQIASQWNGGYIFARRSGQIFEFYGIRNEANRTVYGKAVYTRKLLPANSR